MVFMSSMKKPSKTKKVEQGKRTLLVRDFPDDLRKRVRIAAAHRDTSQRAVVIEACEEWLKRRT